MESKLARYLMCFIGLTAANFAWAGLSDAGTWQQAVHDSYFQGVAFLTLAIADWRRQ